MSRIWKIVKGFARKGINWVEIALLILSSPLLIIIVNLSLYHLKSQTAPMGRHHARNYYIVLA